MYEKIRYFDIETVKGEVNDYLREKKYREKNGESYGLIPEYGRICCFAIGRFEPDGTPTVLSICDSDEKKVLEFIYQHTNHAVTLGGWNIKGFDIPYIIKRFIANGYNVPKAFQLFGKKPREVMHVDLMEVRRSTGNSYSSLDEVCFTLWVWSPKEQLDGSLVQEYYDQGLLEDVATYCEMDVLATMEVGKRILTHLV